MNTKDNSPKMEHGKCLEHCSHKDDMGFCLAGDSCIKYGVNNVTGEPINRPADSYEYPYTITRIDDTMSVVELNSRLGFQLRNLMDRSKSERDHQRDVQDAIVTSALAKTILGTINIALNAPKALKYADRESRETLRKLIQ